MKVENNHIFMNKVKKIHCIDFVHKIMFLKYRDNFGKENCKKINMFCIFDKTLSKVFLNNFHVLTRS